MPLPVPKSNPGKPEAKPREQALPGLPTAQPARQAPPQALPPVNSTAPPRRPRPVEAPAAPKEELPEGWAIDAKTGKKFKQLAANPAEAVAAAKREKGGGLSLEQLFKYTADDPDFDLDDLNGSAETFLAHLRVPVPKEEIAEARRAQARRRAAQTPPPVVSSED